MCFYVMCRMVVQPIAWNSFCSKTGTDSRKYACLFNISILVFITRSNTRNPRRRHDDGDEQSTTAVFAVWARRTLWRAEDATNGALCDSFAATRKRSRVVWSGRRRRRRTISAVTGQQINERSCLLLL
jgi:hypothetical protein